MIKKILFILYILILVCMAAASIVEKLEGTDYAHVHYYGAWWFILIWAALAALGIFYIIQRKVKAVSTWALHLSFVIILVGAFITHVNGKQGMMHLRIGEPSDIYFSNNPAEGIQQRRLPFTLSLQKFDIHLYEGTDVVRDYTSQFMVTDHYEMEEAKVSLNRIYTHGSYRFYQASYDEDGMGSVLAINSDPFGIPVTYCGYFLLFLSLVWILFDKKGGYRKLLQRSWQQFRSLLMVVFSLVGIGFIFLIYHFSHIDFSTGDRAPILNSPYFCVHVSVIMMSYVLLILTCLCGVEPSLPLPSPYHDGIRHLHRSHLGECKLGHVLELGQQGDVGAHHLYDLCRSSAYAESTGFPQAAGVSHLHHPSLPEYRHDLLRCELFPHGHALLCIDRIYDIIANIFRLSIIKAVSLQQISNKQD